ncbi:MAG: NERD domain-containing protein [Acidaminococcales bacterium]|jgi:hypothetical protein|nr:NERD domain-containing protein [Acidaminococcales bacterium]
MPLLIPQVPQNFNGSWGESQAFEALCALDGEHAVFHSFSWLREKGQPGEADFVVAHPGKGILVIEVKSGGIEYKRGEWLQINTKTGYKKRIAPFVQAARSKYAILERLKSFLSPPDTPMVGHAVWFPSVSLSGIAALPPEADKEITLDGADLSQPLKAINRAFAYWERAARFKARLNKAQFGKVLDVLCPHFCVTLKLGDEVAAAERQYIRLTEQQFAILQLLAEQKAAAISGLAGTGKTMLAVEKAKALAEQGREVLLLCFNNFLRDFLKANCAPHSISCHNVHSLAYELLGKPELSFDAILAEFKAFLAGECNGWPYQDVIVDEGQDIDDDILCRLAKLCKSRDGSFYVFYDKNQFVGKNKLSSWLDSAECRLVLSKNCRNTMEISSTAYGIIGAAAEPSKISGIRPRVKFYSTEKELLDITEKFVQYAVKEQIPVNEIAILTAQTLEKSRFTAREAAGLEITNNFGEKGKLLFTTIRKFKGLEADAVLLLDCSLRDMAEEGAKRLLYSGASRAKYILRIAVREDLPEAEHEEYMNKILGGRDLPKSREGLARLFNASF